MDGSASQLGATGGAVQTDNPQNVGTQNITPSQSNLQTQGVASLNSNGLRLTDENGQPFNIATSTTQIGSASQASNSNHNITVIGASALIISVVFLVTWLATRKSSQSSY